MRIQLLSDLHLETEIFHPEPAPEAELLILAGDIDAHWRSLELFANWPVPVIMVAGNHEFDRRDLSTAWHELRVHCQALNIQLIERETLTLTDRQGRNIRFIGTIRWSDFDLFGPTQRDRAQRAASYYLRYMGATQRGQRLDPQALHQESLACRQWLHHTLHTQPNNPCDRTVVITHYAPSIQSADPRYGRQPGTASFCNADDDLIPLADVWIHGHLHCRHHYTLPKPQPDQAPTRIICNARGHSKKNEPDGYDGLFCFEI